MIGWAEARGLRHAGKGLLSAPVERDLIALVQMK